jgi:hypothetical protein
MATPVQADSIFGDEWEKFFQERVKFSGFIENTTGLAVGPDGDRRHFNTSNRFVMNRLTILPEFNVDFHESAKFFISWRFVKEPRYKMEARSRRRTVAPAGAAQPLESTFYDEDSPKPWEAVLDLKPTDLLHLRLGRQFISWGETDGVRLLDVINSQDSTFAPALAPNLFDLDETKIPSWGMRFLYTVSPVNNTILELVTLPGLDEKKQRVDDILGSNDTADARVRYGRWSSHPETRMPFGRMFTNGLAGRPTIIPVVRRKLPDAHDSWKIGTRITHSIGALNFGLGYILGYNPQAADMVFKLKSTAPGPGPTTIANMELINDRTSIFAGHLNYTLGTLADIPFNTAIRGEVAFYPSEPYNISKFPGNSFRAGPHPRHPDGVTEKNTLRYALGFDRTVLIPFLQDDPWRPYRFSFQIFQRIILDHEDGIRFFSTAEKVKMVSSILTLRIGTGYFGDTILPDLFLSYNPSGYWSANPAVTYAPSWNERIKLTLTAALYGGHNKFGFPGLLAEKDSIFLKMRYQF